MRLSFAGLIGITLGIQCTRDADCEINDEGIAQRCATVDTR